MAPPARVVMPSFGGKGYYGSRVHEAVIESGAKVSGCTVHFVDEKLDHGPIILQETVPVEDHDNAASLSVKILEMEHQIYPAALALVCKNQITIRGRATQTAS